TGAYPGAGGLVSDSPTLVEGGLAPGKDSALWNPEDALRSDGESAWGAIPVWPTVEPFTVYAVVKPGSFASGKRTILSTQDGNVVLSLKPDGVWEMASGGESFDAVSALVLPDSWLLVCAVFNGENSLLQVGY